MKKLKAHQTAKGKRSRAVHLGCEDRDKASYKDQKHSFLQGHVVAIKYHSQSFSVMLLFKHTHTHTHNGAVDVLSLVNPPY